MFRSISYDVTFPTGRRLSNELTFQKGYTAITGPNESGKSFIFEMMRYAMFGSSALRGVADDYRTLSLKAEFDIRDTTYRVVRGKRTELYRGDDIIAVGVSPVNAKVVELLGFGLGVFDVANSINQGEVERLGSMTAMERKRLVDSVLGIDALDVVARWGVEEARLLQREVDTIRSTLSHPTEPSKPIDYVPSSQIALNELRSNATELSKLQGWLSHARSEPVEPTSTPPVTDDQAADRRRLRQSVASLEAKVKALPASATHTAKELDEAEAGWPLFDRYRDAQKWLIANPKPQYHRMQLAIFADDWTALSNIDARKRRKAQIDALLEKGMKACPHCGEDIPVEEDAIKAIQAEHDALVVPDHGTVAVPPISLVQIEAEMRLLSAFDPNKYEECSKATVVTAPTIKREVISTYRTQIEQVAERIALLAKLSEANTKLEAMPDYETQLLAYKAYLTAKSRFESELKIYRDWVAEKDTKSARVMELGDATTALTLGERLHREAETYERELKAYAAARIEYERQSGKADELEKQAADHRKVRELMNILRSLIKSHLMPSLNKVASHLLAGMTGGQRQLVVVDEDFNVVVDGQRLETLSGSGKACANLAIRIALGQVLTHRVFSCLLADEIDASMDEFRAQETSKILEILQNSVSQVLLVSHKSIEATHQICLGGFIDTYPAESGGD